MKKPLRRIGGVQVGGESPKAQQHRQHATIRHVLDDDVVEAIEETARDVERRRESINCPKRARKQEAKS
jgi:hypothetical protein